MSLLQSSSSPQAKSFPQQFCIDGLSGHQAVSRLNDGVSLFCARLYAVRAADESGVPQTVFRDVRTGGWSYSNWLTQMSCNAETSVTILPRQYFH